MSVIQSIREKYAKWAVVAIALALLGFILTDYLSTRNRMFGGSNSTTLGSVNGTTIEYADFENKLKQIDDQQQLQAQQQGRTIGESDRQQNIEGLWSQEVEKIIMIAEIEKAGINIGKKELNDWLFGPNAPEEMKRQFSNEQGQYNGAAAQEALNQMKKSPNQSDRDQLNSFLEVIEHNHLVEKFNSLLTNSTYYPKWFIEKQNSETGAIAKISYTSMPYTSIPDGEAKVTDKEIQEYINNHKDQYKQEESRSIAYVVFNASPTLEDSAAIKKQVGDLKSEFEKTTDPAVFLARFGSAIPFFDGYLGKSQIQVPAKDSLFALAKNAVYGPYLDNTNYSLVKLIETKTMPDSVMARHIMIQTADPQKGQMILDDSVGKKRIDSIDLAIKSGASFETLAFQLSDDKGSGAKGGVVANPSNPQTNYFNIGQMVKEFNDFCFEGTKGEKKIVKTVFGYHLVEILDQKNFEPHYKAAYFSKTIVASDETDRTALSNASKFASESRNQKAFDENFQKNLAKEGYQKLIANNIKPNDNTIEGISLYGTSRQLVREIYKADKGDVLQQSRVGDKYIVALVTDDFKEGTMAVSAARASIEPLLRNKKKAEKIKQKLGKISTLEAAATALQSQIQTQDSLRFSGGQLGFEPRVVGAAFNTANKGKIIGEPVAGVSGVYVIKVDELSATPIAEGNIEEQKKQLMNNARQMAMYLSPSIQSLKKAATIKDNRSTFY